MMAWDADWLKNQTLSKWDLGENNVSALTIGGGDFRHLPLRWNSSVKYVHLGEDGVEIPIKWRSETNVQASRDDGGTPQAGAITREDYASDRHDAAGFPKMTSKVLFTQMLAWPNTMQKTCKQNIPTKQQQVDLIYQ